MTNIEAEQIETRVVHSQVAEWHESSSNGNGKIRRAAKLEWNDDRKRYEATVMIGDALTRLIGYFPKITQLDNGGDLLFMTLISDDESTN